MTVENKLLAQKIYLILGALFITSLVVSNLIFQKFNLKVNEEVDLLK